MKINNKPYIKRIILLVLTLAFSLSISCVAYWIVPSFFSTNQLLVMLFLLLLMIFIYSQLRYIEFDSTGEVLVLKSYHPTKDGQILHEIRAIELPRQRIKKYSIKKHFFLKELILEVESESNKKSKKITFSLSQMNNRSLKMIIQELERFPIGYTNLASTQS